MKDIIVSSMAMHLVVIMIFVTFAASFGTFSFYALALFYICVTLKHAIDIADFEMSKLGEVVQSCESGKFRRMSVYFRK